MNTPMTYAGARDQLRKLCDWLTAARDLHLALDTAAQIEKTLGAAEQDIARAQAKRTQIAEDLEFANSDYEQRLAQLSSTHKEKEIELSRSYGAKEADALRRLKAIEDKSAAATERANDDAQHRQRNLEELASQETALRAKVTTLQAELAALKSKLAAFVTG